MYKQRGMTFIGFVIVAVIGLSIVLAGIKVSPAYIEFMTVKKIIAKIGNEPNFEAEFDKGANIGYVTVVTGKELAISKDSSGKRVVSVEYQVVKPLVGNLSALMDFKATTEK
jgi:hypothetical protein